MTRTPTDRAATDGLVLTDFVSGTGTWDDPYTSESGTAGLEEALLAAGTEKRAPGGRHVATKGETTIHAPTGVYSFTNPFRTSVSNVRILGGGAGNPILSPEGNARPQSTLFRLDYEPATTTVGSILHLSGADHDPRRFVFGWRLEDIRFLNGVGADATAVRLDWFPFSRLQRLVFGGTEEGAGFDRGILVNSAFKFTWNGIYGQGNRILIDSDDDFNQGVVMDVQGKPNRNEWEGTAAIMRLTDGVGASYETPNFAAGKPRGLLLGDIAGDCRRADHGLVLRGALGCEVVVPHFERSNGPAVVIDSTADSGEPRPSPSVGVAVRGGFFHDDETAIRVGGAWRTVVEGQFVQAPTPDDATGIEVGDVARNTRIDRVTVHEPTVERSIVDGGTGTVRNGLGTVAGGMPSAGNWEPGDQVEVADDGGGGGVYQLMSDGSTWRQLG